MTQNENEKILNLFFNKIPVHYKEDIYQESRFAFLDFLSCQISSRNLEKVKNISEFYSINNSWSESLTNQLSPFKKEIFALISGFAAHFEDLDDVQANFRGHPSSVIFPALLAVADRYTTFQNLFYSYASGLELISHIGKQVHPSHAMKGYHSTATLGIIGATFAICHLKKLNHKQTLDALSFALNQSSGLIVQEGSDGKPLNAGLAASKAIQSYHFVTCGLTSNPFPFASKAGWQKVFETSLDFSKMEEGWFNPPQILSPGIWYKNTPFCSAGTSIYEAARLAREKGVLIKNIESIICHFTETGDLPLTHKKPVTKLEGKFSAEYLVWLGLKKENVTRIDFEPTIVSNEFLLFNQKIRRLNDLEGYEPQQRPGKLEIFLNNGQRFEFRVDDPKGSPKNPLTNSDFSRKWQPQFQQPIEDIINLMKKDVKLLEFVRFLEGVTYGKLD